MIVLERSTIENDTDSGNKYGFVIGECDGSIKQNSTLVIILNSF